MRNDSRLSRMLHVLLHMGRRNQPFTSEQIAKMLDTNPVVVRRTMAGLRRAGYVRSEKGHGGGWTIACDLKEVTLLDVHNAVGGPKLFAIGHENGNPSCGVARVVNTALGDVLSQAEALIIGKLSAISLADLANEFDAICQSECRGINTSLHSKQQSKSVRHSH
ncbi:Rrf2 family transcriptional regulator [Allopusillimonas soli]|uniref:Rrf2 family transcriptional regulator n=1 Tax=Allopusillimonas soli TaxID=659016 RepID=A0A853F7J2_9BURK|nr:Rrf2 family transcriptional regulator [Allopusillimonas soli]NYT36564.1 Rrf2 family transcriptional regulator [Allopusillimonas soli]TEA75058.1 Rrf2 family transcriptional regulator [Allopusillimonas soli]